MPVDNEETVFAELPATTYRYTSTPFMDSTRAINGLGRDAAVCSNEYGVSMVMSITSFSNKAALAADPLIGHGLTEFTAVDLIVCQSATAREAVETLTALIDRYGSSEVNIALISDQRECWYVELPAGMACITWESVGPCVYGVFVPVSNAVQSVSEPYARNQGREQAYIFDTDNYPYYRFKELCTLCVEPRDRAIYGEPVRAHWHEAETAMAAGMGAVLKAAAAMDDAEAAKRFITDCCDQLQLQAFADAGTLLNNVRWYRSHNSNTMKNGRNPETMETLDELKLIPPMETGLDASPWKSILDAALAAAEQ